MINADDLRYFIELAKTLHVTRASERLGVSQPALSHCINRLETEKGRELFIRSKKGVTLNASGLKLYQASANLLKEWENLDVLIVHGAGYGIAPTRIMQTFSDKNIDRIKDAPVFKDQICLIYRPEFRKLKHGQPWIDTIMGTTF